MRDDKERLMRMLLLDMKHWSLDALKVALNYIDGQILSFTSMTSCGGGNYGSISALRWRKGR